MKSYSAQMHIGYLKGLCKTASITIIKFCETEMKKKKKHTSNGVYADYKKNTFTMMIGW